MKIRWLPVAIVLGLAAGIVVYKQATTRPQSASEKTTVPGPPSVLLFADPREADSADACAEIFRLVRGAGARGVPVREIAPEQSGDATRRYRITVEPTVLVLDQAGREVARHEGESPQTIAAIRSSLERLPAGR